MGASSSVPGLNVIKTSCARIAQVKCQHGVHFLMSSRLSDSLSVSHDLAFAPNPLEQAPTPDAKMMGNYNLTITKDFDAMQVAVTAAAETCCDFDEISASATVPLTDSVTCVLNTSTSGTTLFGASFASNICSTNYGVVYRRPEKEFTIQGDVVIALSDNVIFGVGGVHQPVSGMTVASGGALLTYKFLQASISHTGSLASSGTTVCGVNFFLDRDVVLNACATRQAANGMSQIDAWVGAAAGIGANGVNCGISSSGVITTSFARQVSPDLKITATMGLNLFPMTSTVGLEINMMNI